MPQAKPQDGNEVPFAVTTPTRIPAARYYDQKFYDLECERLWPRVWQMACRLEEIPNPGDYVVYEILDQSVIVVRVDAKRVKAYHNACRHRGVQLVNDRGNAKRGFSCPFHGWRFNLEGENTFLYQPDLFAEMDRDKDDLSLRECRVETWGGCAFINLDGKAAPLRESLEPFASYLEPRGAEKMQTVWWKSTVVPVNWKLAMEAFMEGYHVARTHPQLARQIRLDEGAVYRPVGTGRQSSGTQSRIQRSSVSPTEMMDSFILYMSKVSEDMGGIVLDKDIRVAERLRDTIKLPDEPGAAYEEWVRSLNDAIMAEQRNEGIPVPDLNELAKTSSTGVQFCFPHFFLLSQYGNMASYRIRPLSPESTLFEIWSLTLFPEGEQRPPLKTPTPVACDSDEWPLIPRQDFTNLPAQQKGLHTRGFEFMRLSPEVEGQISNLHQVIDGYLAGRDAAELLGGVQKVSGNIDARAHEITARQTGQAATT